MIETKNKGHFGQQQDKKKKQDGGVKKCWKKRLTSSLKKKQPIFWKCWWKESCTTWYLEYPNMYGVLYIPGGCLGFLNHQHSCNFLAMFTTCLGRILYPKNKAYLVYPTEETIAYPTTLEKCNWWGIVWVGFLETYFREQNANLSGDWRIFAVFRVKGGLLLFVWKGLKTCVGCVSVFC